jgi:hypothetical protein
MIGGKIAGSGARLNGSSRLLADIQQREANDPKRPFKVGIVSARSSAKPDKEASLKYGWLWVGVGFWQRNYRAPALNYRQ